MCLPNRQQSHYSQAPQAAADLVIHREIIEILLESLGHKSRRRGSHAEAFAAWLRSRANHHAGVAAMCEQSRGWNIRELRQRTISIMDDSRWLPEAVVDFLRVGRAPFQLEITPSAADPALMFVRRVRCTSTR